MADENIERRIRYVAEQQGRSAVRMRELEDIVVQFERATRARGKANEQLDSQLRKKRRVKKTDDALARLIADMERYFSESRNVDSNNKR